MIPIALMLMSPILAQRYTVLKLLSSEWARDVYKGLYYVFPKVYDLGRIMINIVRERGASNGCRSGAPRRSAALRWP